MLDSVYADRAFTDGCGTLDCLQIVDLRVDGWFILQIFAFEFDSVIHRRGMNFERHFFAGMQSGAGKAGGFADCMLKLWRRGHGRLSSREFALCQMLSRPTNSWRGSH